MKIAARFANAALRERRVAAPDAAPAEVAVLALHGSACRVVLVDGVVPKHSASKNGGRLRMTYVPHEVAHFEFGSHRYALVAERTEASTTTSGGEGTGPGTH